MPPIISLTDIQKMSPEKIKQISAPQLTKMDQNTLSFYVKNTYTEKELKKNISSTILTGFKLVSNIEKAMPLLYTEKQIEKFENMFDGDDVSAKQAMKMTFDILKRGILFGCQYAFEPNKICPRLTKDIMYEITHSSGYKAMQKALKKNPNMPMDDLMQISDNLIPTTVNLDVPRLAYLDPK